MFIVILILLLSFGSAYGQATPAPEGYYRPGNRIQPPSSLSPGLVLEGLDASWQRWLDANRRFGADPTLLTDPQRRRLIIPAPPGFTRGVTQRVEIDPGGSPQFFASHGMVYVEQHKKIWACSQNTTGGSKIVRFNNLDDLTDQTIFTASTGNPSRCGAIVYVPAVDRLYAMLYNIADFDILEINPTSTTTSEPFDDIPGVQSSGGIPTIVTDGTYLYTCSWSVPAGVVKLNPATYLQVGSTLTLDRDKCHAGTFDDGYLYVTGGAVGTAGWMKKIDPGTSTTLGSPVDSLDMGALQLPSRALLALGNSLYSPLETYENGLLRVRKSDLTVEELIDFNAYKNFLEDQFWEADTDGTYIYVTGKNFNRIIRYDPATREAAHWRGASVDEYSLNGLVDIEPDGRGRLFAIQAATSPTHIIRLAEPSTVFAVTRHPPDLSQATYSQQIPIDWDLIFVDGAQCTLTTLTLTHSGTPKIKSPAIQCTDNALGTIYFNVTVPDSAFGDVTNGFAPHISVEFEAFSNLSSGVLAFNVDCGCAGDGDTPTAGFASPITADADVTFTSVDKRRTFMAVTSSATYPANWAAYRTKTVHVGGSCEHGDLLACVATVDATATTASPLTGTYITGINIEVPSTGMGDSGGHDE